MQHQTVGEIGFVAPIQTLRAAAMMHTDLAYVLLSGGRSSDALTQTNHASRLVDSMLNDRADEAARTFGIRWYAFTTSMFTAHGMFDAAQRLVRAGLIALPRAAELYVARGSIQEMRNNVDVDDELSHGIARDGRPSIRVTRMMELAATDFQRALDLDATMALAHLHRGWAHLQLRDGRASADLEAALAAATDDDVRYLAHLFLGAVAEQHGDLDRARGEFESAKALGGHQTAYVALARTEAALGHTDRARELAADYTRLARKTDDPWWDYRLGGFNAAALRWLRVEARHR